MANSFVIVPAAGRSRRMGRHKLLLPWQKSTVIESVLDAWTQSRVDRVVVVLRCDDTPLIEACRAFPVDVVVPGQAPPEMKDSVRVGLDFLRQTAKPKEEDVWLLAPADMPRLNPGTIDRLLAAHSSRRPAILVPRDEAGRGHPVLFPWPTTIEVSSLGADQGINVLLGRHHVRYIDRPDPTIHDDLDTPEDYKRLVS